MEFTNSIATAAEAVRKGYWSDQLQFAGRALASPLRFGAILPSGASLGRAMARLTRGTRVVELGPGSGSITRHLLDGLRPDGLVLALELDPGMAGHLRQRMRDPRLMVQVGDAADLNHRLDALGWTGADSIVSGLPFQALDPVVRDRILAGARESLAPGGRFIGFQYGLRLLPTFRRHFRTVKVIGPIWLNVPPAFVIVGHS